MQVSKFVTHQRREEHDPDTTTKNGEKMLYIKIMDRIRNRELRLSGMEDIYRRAHLQNVGRWWRYQHAVEQMAYAATSWNPRIGRRNSTTKNRMGT